MKLPRIDVLFVKLHHRSEELRVGRLVAKKHDIFFAYEPDFIARGLNLSPFHLRLTADAQRETTGIFDGLFGLFHDSLPDGWGRMLLDRELEMRGIDRGALTPLHRLAYIGRRGMGALSYEPELESSAVRSSKTLDLDALARSAKHVLDGRADVIFPALLALGGSSGGARPKVMLGWRPEDDHLLHGAEELPPDHLPYLIKFRAPHDDPVDVGRIEWAYNAMARAAGLEVSESHLFLGKKGAAYFGSRRFDRAPNGARVHIHSLGGLLHASHHHPGSLSYEDFMRATWMLTKDQRQVALAYRRMVFNVLARNRDDHVKNFAFAMDAGGEFTLSPAYDLTFSNGPGGEHWMSIAGEGHAPGESHLLEVAKTAGVAEREAHKIIDTVRAAIADWRRFAKRAGLSQTSRERIAKALGLRPETRRRSK